MAFVADGALLPRHSGVDDRPLADGRPFRAPEELAIELPLPDGGSVRGLGVPAGVTLIVGGGYHGKSTLLDALAQGVWDHRPGDGRERVVTDADAVTIRAEDGRRVAAVDISGFIGELPGGRDTVRFDSEDASGSTSQAAAIAEALEVGARVLLIDEDTSATNFMVRDRRMQALVSDDHEPIVPLVDRVRELTERRGVSTVLVMGGSGDYLDVADTVIAMHEYVAGDVTARARTVAAAHPTLRQGGARTALRPPTARRPEPASIDPSRGSRPVRIATRGTDEIVFGRTSIDLSAVEQLVAGSQLRTVARALVRLRDEELDGATIDLRSALERLESALATQGLDLLTASRRGDLATVRRHEVAAALNRLHTLRIAP